MNSTASTRIRLQPTVIFWPAVPSATAFFFDLLALGGEQVDANHRSPVFRSARPTATAAVGAQLFGIGDAQLRRLERDRLERIEHLDRRC